MLEMKTMDMHMRAESIDRRRIYVSSSPEDTLVLAMRVIRLSSSPTLMILA